jgi:hypothetical protein
MRWHNAQLIPTVNLESMMNAQVENIVGMVCRAILKIWFNLIHQDPQFTDLRRDDRLEHLFRWMIRGTIVFVERLGLMLIAVLMVGV